MNGTTGFASVILHVLPIIMATEGAGEGTWIKEL
jgi:hypothetical protein